MSCTIRWPHIGIILLLGTGCSSNGDQSEIIPGQWAADYSLLTAENGTTPLYGSGIRSSHTGISTIVQTSGLFDNQTGGISLNDSFYQFTGSSAPIDGYIFGNDNGASVYRTDRNAPTRQFVSETYEYVELYELTYQSDADRYTIIGIHGSLTDPAHIPDATSIIYAGSASILRRDQSGGEAPFHSTQSMMEVRFADQQARLHIEELGPDSPIKTVTIDDIALDGNRFHGGKLTVTYTDATISDFTSTALRMIGHFFGYNNTLQSPDEMGGVFLAEDRNGSIDGFFVGQAQRP